MIKNGERIVRITSTRAARKYGNWYLNLVGTEFSVIMYSIMEAEYTVSHNGMLYQLPDEDITIISDTGVSK